MRIATWNINSVRLRIQHVIRFLEENNVDIICLQETKADEKVMQQETFVMKNYHLYFTSAEKKGYSGVALLLLFSALSARSTFRAEKNGK